MTDSYKIQGRRGRFQRSNIGSNVDEIRRQASTITDALKVQAAREAEYGNKHLAALKGVASNENENLAILNRFRNQKHRTNLEAIEKRGRTEAEYYRGKAKEAELDEKFWADFTKTGSKHYGQLAKDLHQIADHIHGNQKFNEVRRSDKYDAFINEIETEENKELNTIAEKRREALTQEDYDSVNILKGLSLTGNKYSELMADDIISKTDLYESAMESFLNKEGTKENYNKLTARKVWSNHAFDLLNYYNISPTSSGGRKIIQHFEKLGLAKSIRLKNEDDVKEGESLLQRDLAIFTKVESRDPLSFSRSLEDLFTTVQSITTYDKKTDNFILPKDKTNRRLAIETVSQILIEQGWFSGPTGSANRDKFLSHKLVGKDGKTLIGGTIGNKWIDFVSNFDKRLDQYNRDQKSKLDAAIVAEDVSSIQGLERRLNLPSDDPEAIDLSTQEGRDTLFHASKGTPAVSSWANAKLFYDPQKMARWSTHSNLLKAWDEGDTVEFMNLYSILEPNKKDQYAGLFADAKALTESGYTLKNQKSWSKSLVQSRVKGASGANEAGGAIKGGLHESATFIIDALNERVSYYFTELATTHPDDPRKRLAEARKLARTDFDSQTGVFSTRGAAPADGSTGSISGQVEYPFFMDGIPDSIISDDIKDQPLEEISKAYLPFNADILNQTTLTLDGIIDQYQTVNETEGGVQTNFRLIPEQEIARLNQAIIKGYDNLTIPQVAIELGERYNTSPTKIMNKILEASGSEVKWPATNEDLLERITGEYTGKRHSTARMIHWYLKGESR